MPRKNQKRAFLLSFLLLFLYLVLELGFSFVNSHKDRYAHLRYEFHQEVHSSLLNLSSALSDITQRLEKKKGVSLFDSNFSRRFLSPSLRVAEVDQLEVFTSDCKLIWNYSLSQGKESLCFGKTKELFSISNYKGSPFASVSKELMLSGRSYFVQASLSFGKSWLRNHPILEKSLLEMGMKISSKGGYLDLMDQDFYRYPHVLSEDIAFGIHLISNNYLYNLLPFLFKTKAPLDLKGKEVFLLLILLLLLSLFYEFLRSEKLKKKSYSEFVNWCDELSSRKEKELYGLCLKEIRGNSRGDLSELYRSSSGLVSKSLQENFSLQGRVQELEKHLKQQKKELASTEKQRSSYHDFCSLSDQLTRVGKEISLSLESMERLHKKVYSRLTEGDQGKVDLMNQQLLTWKEEGDKSGFRRYLRTLYESKGIEEGRSLLDDQVEFFWKVSSRTLRTFKESSGELKRVFPERENFSLFVKHIRSLIEPLSEEVSVFELLERSSILYKVIDRGVWFDFEKVKKDLMLPRSLDGARFVSAFFHLFSFVLSLRGNSISELVTVKYKSEGLRDFFLISSTCELPREGEASYRQYELAEKLLLKMGVALRFLDLDGGLFLSLEWNRSHDSLAPKPVRHKEHELGS